MRDELMLNLSGRTERVKQMNPMHGIPLSGTINRRREICFCLSGAVQRNNNSASSCTIKNRNLLTGAEDGSPSLPFLIDLVRSARTFNPVRRRHCGRQVIYGKGFSPAELKVMGSGMNCSPSARPSTKDSVAGRKSYSEILCSKAQLGGEWTPAAGSLCHRS